jgi:hypothetical protein
VTFGQKRSAKTKLIFAPIPRSFRRPVIDFLQRSAWLRLVIAVECEDYPPFYRQPRRSALNGDDEELLGELEYDPDGHPKLPAFLDRRRPAP